jgi:hypothetical protein
MIPETTALASTSAVIPPSVTTPDKVTSRIGTLPEVAAIRRRDAEPIEDPVLTDAEEEELAELWAGDPGNQGA